MIKIMLVVCALFHSKCFMIKNVKNGTGGKKIVLIKNIIRIMIIICEILFTEYLTFKK